METRVGTRDLVVFLLIEALALSACWSPHTIHTEELYKLDGFTKGSVVDLVDIEGETHEFTDRTPISLVLRHVGETPPARFEGISIAGGWFEGRTASGEVLYYPMDHILSAKLYVFDLMRVLAPFGVPGTIGVAILTIAISALLFVVVLGIVLYMWALFSGDLQSDPDSEQ